MLIRLVSFAVGAPIVLGLLLAPWSLPFKILVQICTGVALYEFFRLGRFSSHQRKFGIGLGTIHGAALLYLPISRQATLLEIAAVVICVFGYFLEKDTDLEGVGYRVGYMLLGLFYVGTLGPLIGLLRDLPDGVPWVFLLLAVTWLNDTFAYFAGHWWGKRKLAPKVSPGKTWEGLVGGLVGSLAGLLLVWHLGGRFFPFWEGLVLAVVSGFIGPLGDLGESLVKRGAAVKDSGQLIPGHGGMLDRIDALLFNAPLVYGFALWHS